MLTSYIEWLATPCPLLHLCWLLRWTWCCLWLPTPVNQDPCHPWEDWAQIGETSCRCPMPFSSSGTTIFSSSAFVPVLIPVSLTSVLTFFPPDAETVGTSSYEKLLGGQHHWPGSTWRGSRIIHSKWAPCISSCYSPFTPLYTPTLPIEAGVTLPYTPTWISFPRHPEYWDLSFHWDELSKKNCTRWN